MLERTPRKQARTRMGYVAVVLSLLAVLAGCSSGGSDAATDETPAAETTSDAPTAEDPTAPPAEEPEGTEVDDPSDPDIHGGSVVFEMSDRFTRYEDGEGTVVLSGTARAGVLRVGDGLELEGGGPDTGTTIMRITVGSGYDNVVESLSPGEYGHLLVAGEFDDFTPPDEFVRPID